MVEVLFLSFSVLVDCRSDKMVCFVLSTKILLEHTSDNIFIWLINHQTVFFAGNHVCNVGQFYNVSNSISKESNM